MFCLRKGRLSLKCLYLTVVIVLAAFIFCACSQTLNSPIVCTVTFNTLCSYQIDSLQISENDLAVEPNEPIRQGYTFACWLDENGEPFDFFTPITRNITLYAKWNSITYSVIYDYNCGNPETYATEDEDILLNSPSRTGYDFKGWYNGFKTITTIEKGSIGNISLTAQWELITYTISYDYDCDNPIEYTIETQTITLNNPIRNGYSFTGWYNGFKTVTTIEKGSIGNISLTAQWAPIIYTISYDYNCANPDIYTIETQTITLNSPSKNGYSFAGWHNGHEIITIISKGSIGNISLTAQWELITYTISYDYDCDNPIEYTIEDEDLFLNVPSRTGYVFNGWHNGLSTITAIEKGNYGNLSLTAQWEIIKYKITYDAGGNEKNINPASYDIESEFALAELSRRGYKFLGWFADGIKREKIEKGTTGDIILTAYWEIEHYRINYELYGGINNSDNRSIFTILDEFTLLDPHKDGDEFLGWYLDADLIVFIESIEKNQFDYDLTLHASWKKIVYVTATFITDNAQADSVVLIQHSRLAIPNNPDRSGYDFVCWLDESGEPFDFQTPIIDDIILTAKWSLITYAVSYILNGGTNSDLNPLFYTIESVVSFCNPIFLGYDFLGWFNNAQKINGINQGTVGNLILNAAWAPSVYTISYDYDCENPETYTIETKTITLKEPGRNGYRFDGWYNGSEIIKIIPNGTIGNLILRAQWIPIIYTISYDYDCGNPATYTIETETITLVNPVREGREFDGWHNGSEIITTIPKGTTGNLTLKAQWKSAVVYTINYDYDCGNPTEYTIETETITLKEPARNGYDFDGWHNGSEIITTIHKGTTGNLTLTARWTLVTYTINYDCSYDCGNPAEYTIETKTIILKEPAKEGYEFSGWYNGSTLISIIEKGSYNNLALTAQWIPIIYTIKYDCSCDCGNPTEYTIETETITLKEPARNGYDFDGWHNGFEIITTIHKGTTGNLTLTARWTLITYTINYDCSCDCGNPAEYTIETKTIILKEPAKEGYEFSGWYNGSEPITVISEGSTGNLKLTASWIEIKGQQNFEETLNEISKYLEAALKAANKFSADKKNNETMLFAYMSLIVKARELILTLDTNGLIAYEERFLKSAYVSLISSYGTIEGEKIIEFFAAFGEGSVYMAENGSMLQINANELAEKYISLSENDKKAIYNYKINMTTGALYDSLLAVFDSCFNNGGFSVQAQNVWSCLMLSLKYYFTDSTMFLGYQMYCIFYYEGNWNTSAEKSAFDNSFAYTLYVYLRDYGIVRILG